MLLQVVHVLDQIVASTTKDDSSLSMAQATWTEAHQSRIHALWAILDQLPNEVLTTLVLPLLHGAQIHPRVRRWTALFQFIPPFVDLLRMGEHLLFVRGGHGTNKGTVIQLLWDLALVPSVVVHQVQEDATYALQSWSHAILAANFDKVDSLDVFSCALLRLLMSGPVMRQFAIIASDHKGLDNVLVMETLAETSDATQILARLEKSSKFAIEKLILPLSQESVAKSNTALPSRLLQLLVVLHFCPLATQTPKLWIC